MRSARLALLAATLLAVGACDDNTPVCVPDQPTACDCPTGGPGQQSCAGDGLSLGTCTCTPDAGADADTGAIDGPPDADVAGD